MLIVDAPKFNIRGQFELHGLDLKRDHVCVVLFVDKVPLFKYTQLITVRLSFKFTIPPPSICKLPFIVPVLPTWKLTVAAAFIYKLLHVNG